MQPFAIIGMAVVGITTGYFGSYAMIIGPTMVAHKDAELAGNVMTLFLLVGLTLGSTFALALNAMMGNAGG
jgi:hypothetical protein